MTPVHLQFLENYEIIDTQQVEKLYELDELVLFLPAKPTEDEKQALQELIGTVGETHGYMDYAQSNNTFELIMQWREKTGNL